MQEPPAFELSIGLLRFFVALLLRMMLAGRDKRSSIPPYAQMHARDGGTPSYGFATEGAKVIRPAILPSAETRIWS